MGKISLKPGTMLNPVPAVMVSCGEGDVKNIITVAWTGIINSDPPMTYVSVRKERFSHDIIERTGEFDNKPNYGEVGLCHGLLRRKVRT